MVQAANGGEGAEAGGRGRGSIGWPIVSISCKMRAAIPATSMCVFPSFPRQSELNACSWFCTSINRQSVASIGTTNERRRRGGGDELRWLGQHPKVLILYVIACVAFTSFPAPIPSSLIRCDCCKREALNSVEWKKSNGFVRRSTKTEQETAFNWPKVRTHGIY